MCIRSPLVTSRTTQMTVFIFTRTQMVRVREEVEVWRWTLKVQRPVLGGLSGQCGWVFFWSLHIYAVIFQAVVEMSFLHTTFYTLQSASARVCVCVCVCVPHINAFHNSFNQILFPHQHHMCSVILKYKCILLLWGSWLLHSSTPFHDYFDFSLFATPF